MQDLSNRNTQTRYANEIMFSGQQLPMWPEPMRGGPNTLLRSALFAAIHSSKRKQIGRKTSNDKEPVGIMIAAQDGIEITYAGTQLNQYDADVFFEAAHRARKELLETECTFKGAEFLKAIGRTRNNLNYEDLDESFRRLRRGELVVKWTINGRQYVFTGSLIASYVRETTTKLYRLSFAKEVGKLFAAASWTQLEWEQRKALKGKPLAQWLHSYFSTHAQPYPVSVGYLHEKSGSQTTLLKHFKTELKNAFKSLHDIIGWEFEWRGDVVILNRPPSLSQARYLEKKKRQALEAKKQRDTQHKRKWQGQPTSIADILPPSLFTKVQK